MTTFKVKCLQAKAFCKNAADAQLVNIYHIERNRALRNRGTETGRLAKRFARHARLELERRNLWPV